MRPEREEAADRVITWLQDGLLMGWLRHTFPEPADSMDVIRQLARSHARALAMKEQLLEDIASLTDEECEEVQARIRQSEYGEPILAYCACGCGQTYDARGPEPGVISETRGWSLDTERASKQAESKTTPSVSLDGERLAADDDNVTPIRPS